MGKMLTYHTIRRIADEYEMDEETVMRMLLSKVKNRTAIRIVNEVDNELAKLQSNSKDWGVMLDAIYTSAKYL